MNTLQAGFARSNITPPLGIKVAGYYQERIAVGVLDELEVNALALKVGEEKALLICADLVAVGEKLSIRCKNEIFKRTGVPADNIFISATHTHTGPAGSNDDAVEDTLEYEYSEFLVKRIIDTAVFAVNDLKNAVMGHAVGTAPKVAFVRRFIMKDGRARTNPGINNPDIVRPAGETDERVSILRFDRESGDAILFVNFANHPDVIDGCLISGDWPTLMRHDVEKFLDNTKCIFFNGCQGDVNHVNVHPTGGDFTEKGYDFAKHIARVVACGAIQVFDTVKYVEVDRIAAINKPVMFAAMKPTPEEYAEAKYINDMHLAGRDSELPWEDRDMILTTVLAEARTRVNAVNAPDYFEMPIFGMVIGPVALIGIPGEPFTGIGMEIKAAGGYDMIIPCALTCGCTGYFPMQDAYDQGGYEARSSPFKPGVGEIIIEESKKILEALKK